MRAVGVRVGMEPPATHRSLAGYAPSPHHSFFVRRLANPNHFHIQPTATTVLGRQGKPPQSKLFSTMAEDGDIMDVAAEGGEEETPVVEEELELNEESALRGVLRKALAHDGLQRGLHE